MVRRSISAALLLIAGAALAEEPFVVYTADGYAFDEVRENLESAITEQGLVISGTLHISDMLVRTGADLGFSEPVYDRAESVEFCSALMSHRMVAADPVNLTVCPFTIALYSLAGEPGQVRVAFRRNHLAGDAPEVEQAVFEMLDGIARQAIE